MLTADNSRSEPTSAIIEAVRRGHERAAPRQPAEVEPDRRHAIALVLSGARSGDVVVVAGKGHETTQTIGDRTEPFDDREVARAALEAMGSDAPHGGPGR